MVEVKRHDFAGLPKVMQELSRWGKKFIVVLDDLSFEEFEVEYKALKSILDGGLEVKPDNVLFYATSNRRNIIKEVWQDQNMSELHSRDSINEKISLADRFGIKLFLIRWIRSSISVCWKIKLKPKGWIFQKKICVLLR